MYNPREAQFDLLITRSVLAFFVIIILGFVGSLGLREGVMYTLIKLSPLETTGQITAIDTIETVYIKVVNAHYTFNTSSKKTNKGYFELIERYDNREYSKGDTVEIIYSALLPKYNSVKNRLKYNEFSFYLFMFTSIVSLLCILFIFWNTFRYYKFKKSSKHY